MSARFRQRRALALKAGLVFLVAFLSFAGPVLGRSLEEAFPPPDSFYRTAAFADSFALWLRNLPLKCQGASVKLWNGKFKRRQNAHAAVVDFPILRFQQCADGAIRLYAEYLWETGKKDAIRFKFTSGDECAWSQWREGSRPKVSGNRVEWVKSAEADSSRQNFDQYLVKVFEYAGTASLSRDLTPVSPADLRPGDVIVQGGHPGHAVMVLDTAGSLSGEIRFLLGQSYMPAQDIHVLKNPADPDSPWYALPEGEVLVTPEWTFTRLSSQCRRF